MLVAAGRWPVLKDLIVSVTESVPIFLAKRRRDRRIAEARMPVYIWRSSSRDVAPACFDAIVIALLRSLRVGRWRRRRWWIVAGMAASRERKRQRQ